MYWPFGLIARNNIQYPLFYKLLIMLMFVLMYKVIARNNISISITLQTLIMLMFVRVYKGGGGDSCQG